MELPCVPIVIVLTCAEKLTIPYTAFKFHAVDNDVKLLCINQDTLVITCFTYLTITPVPAI